MSKYKLMLSVILSIAIVVTTSPVLYASNNNEIVPSGEIHTETAENLATDETITPRGNCTECYWFTTFYCWGNHSIVEIYTHERFLGLGETCKVTCKIAYGSERCMNCGLDQWLCGFHDCIQEHSVCNDVNMCPMPSL